MPNQTTDRLLMVRPANFARHSATVSDNAFQDQPDGQHFHQIAEAARAEFDHMVALLREAGVTVLVVEDTPVPVKPDAVFPNNWFTTHEDGVLLTYPYHHAQRRSERRRDILELLDREFVVRRAVPLEHWEEAGRFLEGTGSLILDRVNRVVYACLSQRCDRDAVHDWCAAMDFKPVTFTATDPGGQPIYHTNVMMALGTAAVIICLDCIADPGERAAVTDALLLGGREIVAINQEQVTRFAGNALELRTQRGPLWVMSSSAYHSLGEEQLARLLAPEGMRLLHVPLPNIERFGGGSARCMMAEIFLPERP